MNETSSDPIRRRRRPRGWRAWLLGFLLILLLLLVLLWFARFRVASYYVDRELERRGVQATYQVKRIGWGRQIFENMVIGDPRRPDATLRRVEVQVLVGLGGPRVGLIRARGVRLFGRVRNGRLTLGQIDRLLPPPSGLPFRLPDQAVDVEDAAIALDTPAGKLALGLSGRGNLADGFRGRLALVSRSLRFGSCSIGAGRGSVAVAVSDLRPSIDGPVRFGSFSCGSQLGLVAGSAKVKASFSPALDRWRGFAELGLPDVQAQALRLAAVEGQLSFAGTAARTAGRLDLTSGPLRLDGHRSARSAMVGHYQLSLDNGAAAFDGKLDLRGLRAAPGAASPALAGFRSAAATPLGAIAANLAGALERAVSSDAAFSARLRVVNGPGYGGLRLSRAQLRTASGARLEAAGERTATYYWPSDRLRLEGDYALSGGGFPSSRLSLRASGDGTIRGTARIAPMRAGRSRLALGDIDFLAAEGTTRFRSAVSLDGPIGDGQVTGLAFPIEGRFGSGGLRIGSSCLNAGFRAAQIQGLSLGATRVQLCPTGPALVWQPPGGRLRFGGLARNVRLDGRLGGTPLRLASADLRFDQDGLSARSVAARLGGGSEPSRLDISHLRGRFVQRGIAGDFDGLSGKISGVPLLIGEASGRWRVVGGDLAMEGRLLVSDAQDPRRFKPLLSPDFTLRLADGKIRADGPLIHPGSGRRVASVGIDHDLDRGAGRAQLDVAGIDFDPSFQPEALTPLTVGVVALVNGRLEGQGIIEWDAQGTRSRGTFSTPGMDLAAPFGPVEGLKTRIEFTDLLGLVSAPGQLAEVALVRPGVDVYDGRILFQLRPDYHVAVESGRWPYAGGELVLQSTNLDFSQPSTKYLTFQVIGLDAARFIANMEFTNIAATGIFDGLIPMEFDLRGGRITGGRLAARQPGGTLSYIGELTDRDLGIYGKMAFDALKALRYDRLDMTLDGALDGEFVTNIDLDGIARNPGGAIQTAGGPITQLVARRVISQLATIPFEFNIRIRGPFRALIASARSFEDPSLLIQPVLPRSLRDLPTSVTDVQDEESESRP